MPNNPTAFTSAFASPSAHGTPPPVPLAEELDQRVAEAAYYRAEKRGFAPGHEIEDWLAAEEDIHRQLAKGD